MPYLRVVRDKRGYETSYLLHAPREGASPDRRVLYVFRSPGDVRVGRHPLEPEVRRELEMRYPDIRFDWDTLLSSRQVIDAAPPERRGRRRPTAEAVPAPRRPDASPSVPRLNVPTAIEGETAEQRMRFLAHWHGILCEQLPTRIADPGRRAALQTLTDRLNPAGWIEPDEISSGLQAAAEALERLSHVFAKRKRKPRKGRSAEGPRSAPRAAALAIQAEGGADSTTGSADAEPS